MNLSHEEQREDQFVVICKPLIWSKCFPSSSWSLFEMLPSFKCQNQMKQTSHIPTLFLRATCFSMSFWAGANLDPSAGAVLRLNSAPDQEASKPLWWRLMIHQGYPTNNFHISFVFPAAQKTCLKYHHPSTTVCLWWLNLAVAPASLVIPARRSRVACSSPQGHSLRGSRADSGCLSLFLSRRIFGCGCSPGSMKLLMKFPITSVGFGIPQLFFPSCPRSLGVCSALVSCLALL